MKFRQTHSVTAAAAPENRPVPERSSPQRPVKAPQQREEQPRDRGRRELPR